jgi:polyketide cyclase/dehydrase/lipid transport protein
VALFEVHRDSALTAPQAWARLTDWRRHGDFIPFTEVAVTGSAPHPPGTEGAGRGATFVARTSIGPLHFDDPMEVTHWRPPVDGDGICRLVKTGRVVTGWAVLTVTPTPTGCSITWKEDAAVRFTGTLLGWPTRLIAAKVFGRLVDNLLKERPDAQ